MPTDTDPAVDMCVQRLTRPGGEEGFRAFPYDDATGLRVKAPEGNVSIGFGYNLDAGMTLADAMYLCSARVSRIKDTISANAWYSGANAARQSVFLDIAFNQGVNGLLKYPHMLSCATEGDWAGAAAQCTVSPSEPEGLQDRYRALAAILGSGTDPAYTP
jgi:lysozyme